MDIQTKPKILIVHNYYQIPGGEDTVVANEKKLLEDHGHEVVFYSRNNSELKSFSYFQKLCLPFTTIFSMKTYKEVKRIIKERKIDIVHVHNTLNLVSPAVYYAAFSCNIPLVQTVHNFRLLCSGGTFYREDERGNGHICEDCVSKGMKCAVKYKCYRGSRIQTLASVVTSKIHRFLGTYKKIDGYICLSEFNKSKLKYLLDAKKIFIKPNFTPKIIGKDKANDKDDYYLYIGRLETNKGIPLLIEAFSKMQDKSLVIIGDGTYKEDMLKMIDSYGMKNIKYKGFCTGDKKSELIKNAKSVIVPSQWYEPFGLVAIEAYAHGTPVIAADIGTLSDIVVDSITGFKFQFDSVEALISAINKMETADRELLRNAVLKVHREKYTDTTNYIMLSEIYTTIKKKIKV